VKYEELRDQIKTGDLLLVDGNGFVSDVIEKVTGGRFSHVAVIFRLGDGLFIAEEWEGIGFQIMPLSQKLAQVDGRPFLGIAPEVVRANPGAVMAEIGEYRATPSLQPYGYGTLVKVAAADDLGAKIDPEKVQAVCSVFAERCYIRAGLKFPSLLSPSDFDEVVAGTVPIEVPA